jgi:hypothetical protein
MVQTPLSKDRVPGPLTATVWMKALVDFTRHGLPIAGA